MTSDAKVGLLLGLVFIIIIAFIINGLPRFRSNTNNNELTTDMNRPRNAPLGIADNERKAWEVFERAKQVEEESIAKIPSPSESQDTIRFEMPLPRVALAAKEDSVKEGADDIEKPIVTASDTNTKINIERSKNVGPASPQIYVVSEGDNLAVIAQKFYGSEEGNRRVNVARIFEANREQMKSPDEVYVGQKLIIPPLTTSTADEGKIRGVFSRSLFEKVTSIGRKRFSVNTPKPPRSSVSRQYIVREDDNLWKIAAKLLGDGTRYKEISKLNAALLEDEDSLAVGMRLKIPAL